MIPWREAESLKELFLLYRGERPDLVHHITIKPVLYGSLSAKASGIPAIINTIPGLGYTFLRKGLKGNVARQAISLIYKVALAGRRVRVIFQNPDDRRLFISKGLVTPERAVLIRSSGVDILRFKPSPEMNGIPIILMASRLIWDKGVGELVKAAQLLKGEGDKCRVVLVGTPDLENPNYVPIKVLQDLQAQGVIEWWELREDMPEVLKQASVVVLPSYYPEGLPKILLEAAASGRPIVTTDTPGCREIVRHGENGFLVPPRDPVALAEALHVMLRDSALRGSMGARGREIAVNEFSEERILGETLAVYRELLGKLWPEKG